MVVAGKDYSKKRSEMTVVIRGAKIVTMKQLCKKMGIEYTRKGSDIFVRSDDAERIKQVRPRWEVA